MIAALCILGILVVLIIAFCMSWVGIHAQLTEGYQVLHIRIGLIRFRIYPAKRKAKKGQKETKKAEKSGEKGKSKKKALPKFKLKDIKDAVRTLWPPLKRALERTRKGIRIDPLDLNLVLGGREDPADAAKLYAYLHAGMWVAMPLLEQVIDIPDPHLHVGMDFLEPKHILAGEASLKARVSTLLSAALIAGIPALKWYLRWKKQQTLTAAQPVVSERTEANGQ